MSRILSTWGASVVEGGAYMAGGACMVGEIATAADGTHPTGMRSCFLIFLLSSHKIYSPWRSKYSQKDFPTFGQNIFQRFQWSPSPLLCASFIYILSTCAQISWPPMGSDTVFTLSALAQISWPLTGSATVFFINMLTKILASHWEGYCTLYKPSTVS